MCLFFELPAEATVSILDAEGNLVNVCQYQSAQTISLSVDKLGKYEILICYSSKEFVGNFDLE